MRLTGALLLGIGAASAVSNRPQADQLAPATGIKHACRAWVGDAALNRWCTNNCQVGFCPADKCACMDGQLGVAVGDAASSLASSLAAAASLVSSDRTVAAAPAPAAAAAPPLAASHSLAAKAATAPAATFRGPRANAAAATVAPKAAEAASAPRLYDPKTKTWFDPAATAAKTSRVYDAEYAVAMGATPAADVPRSAPAHVSLEAKAPAAASRVYDEEYSMAMAEQSAMAAEAAVKSDKTTKAVEAKAKVAEVQKNKDEMLRLKDSVKADVLAARGKELAAKRLESSSQASSEVATEVKEGKAVKEVKGAKEAKGEKKAEKPGFWPFTSWDEKEEKEEPLDVGVLQAVVADDIAKAKDGSLQAGEGHFKFGVSAGKRPSPTSTTSASSTKLDIVKPATTDLHHTTLSDEHHKPDAMKEMPAHPATTSKGAASYLEGAKKVAAASASSKSSAAAKSGAVTKGGAATKSVGAAAAASELKAKKTTDFHKVAWGASGNGPHKAKTAAATLVSHDSGAKRAANALLKPAGGKQAARQAQARRAANLAQTETASTAAGVKSAAHLAKEAAAKKPSALSTTTKLSQKAAAGKSAAKSASAASKTAAPAAAAGVKSAAHLAKEAKEAKAAGVKSAAHLANDAKEAKAKAHATAAKEAPFAKAAWGASSNGPHKGNKAAAKAKATALLSKEAKARRAHLPKKAGGGQHHSLLGEASEVVSEATSDAEIDAEIAQIEAEIARRTASMGISTKLGKVAVLASNARTGCTSVSGDADLHTWCVANCAAGLCPAGTCTCADGQDHDHAHSPPTLASSVGLASSPQAELTCRALVPTATDSWCEANCGGGHPCPPAVCSCGPQADADANTALSKFQTSPPNDAEDGAIASDANASQSAKVPNAEDVPCEGPVCAPSAADMSDPNYNATAEAAPKKDLTFRLEMLGRYARQKSKESTQTTIAIGFLTRDTLPLFDKVWSSFFEGCNGRAAVPIVHMQADPESEDGAAVRHDMAKRIEPYGGAIVPHEKTVYGEMRFSFNMVSGMFALARTAAKHRAPNGRLPDWIHFASERCAPIRPCPALQRFLDDSQGVNHLESSPATSVGVQMVAQTNVPEEFQPLTMSSQWATLWLPDVMQLTEIEDELREKWGPRSHPAPIYGIQVSAGVHAHTHARTHVGGAQPPQHTARARCSNTLQPHSNTATPATTPCNPMHPYPR